MPRSARSIVLATVAAGWTLLVAAGGCGLDAVGLRDLPADAATTTDVADAASADATGDVTDDPVTLEVGVVVEAAPPPPGPCDDPSLVLCVRFDGSAADSAHGQAISVMGNVSYVTGKEGQAALLDTTSVITTPDGPAWQYSSLTVEMWARPDTLPSGGGRAGLLDKDQSFGIFMYSDGSVGCILNQTASGTAFATLGTWVHVACVNDGTSTKLYVDGALKAMVAGSAVNKSTALAAIGNNSPNLGSPWIGALDMVRVYARAKTATEIADDAKP